MKITTHMTFYNSISLRYRFNYINRIIKEICNYPYETDLYIHTNEVFSRKFLIENTNGKIEIIHHDFSNKEHDPYYLAWSCRSLLKEQKNDYDIFIYIEDDILIPCESLKYWLEHKDELIKNNYNLGFVRIETDAYNNEYLGDLHNTLKLENSLVMSGKKYIINDVNPYCGSWIYDKKEFNVFLNSLYYHGNGNIPYIYGIREGSAIGMNGFGMNIYKNTLIPLDIENKELHPGCKIYHLENDLMYINETSRSSTILFKDVFSKKIVDCFIFYNEIELLTYRFNVLYDIVDYFVIVEATHTFVGNEKKLYFNENKHLFEKFQDKIVHIIVDDFPFKYPNIHSNSGQQWINEYFHRNCISRGLDRIDRDLNDNDFIIIADLDEIPDPATLLKIKKGEIIVDLNILELDFYYYNLNTRFDSKWIFCKILTYHRYKQMNISCNDIRNKNCPSIKNGGWHLSYFGDSNFIKNKIINFSHQELNTNDFTDLSKIEKRIKEGRDLYDRENHDPTTIEICNNHYLPVEYETYLKNYYTA